MFNEIKHTEMILCPLSSMLNCVFSVHAVRHGKCWCVSAAICNYQNSHLSKPVMHFIILQVIGTLRKIVIITVILFILEAHFDNNDNRFLL